MDGSRPCFAKKAARQRCSANHFSSVGSCHEWDKNASQHPRQHPSARSNKSVKASALSGELQKSFSVSFSTLMQRNRFLAWIKASSPVQPPTRPAIPAEAVLWTLPANMRLSCTCPQFRERGRTARPRKNKSDKS